MGDGVPLLDQLTAVAARALRPPPRRRGPSRCAGRGAPAGQKVSQGEARAQTRDERGLEPAAEKEPPRDVTRVGHALELHLRSLLRPGLRLEDRKSVV